jgi:sialic acid synthase SpsE
VDEHLGVSGTFYDLLERVSLPYGAQKTLHATGLPFASTPFNFEDVDFLVSLGVPFLKVGSTDVNNLPFLAYMARTGVPLLLSTGMATLAEVQQAVDCIRRAGNPPLALMHCVSLYPPMPEELNLQAIPTLKAAFPGVPIGFSDHTIGVWAATAAVALGATIIEKHFTLDKTMAGPDQAVSADPAEFAALVSACQMTAKALETAGKQPSARELSMRPAFRRSVVSRRAIPAGATITEADLTLKRPGTGLVPDQLEHLLGCRAQSDIPADTPLQLDMVHFTVGSAL